MTAARTKAQQESVTQVNIPKTAQAMRNQLFNLGLAIQQGEWTRAAMVFAFTEPGRPGRKPANTGRTAPKKMSFEEFAKLGIVGLRTRKTVALYWKIWNESPATLKVDVEPGAVVQLPDEEEHAWEDAYRTALGIKEVPDTEQQPEPEPVAVEDTEPQESDDIDESTGSIPKAPPVPRVHAETLAKIQAAQKTLGDFTREELIELATAAMELGQAIKDQLDALDAEEKKEEANQ